MTQQLVTSMQEKAVDLLYESVKDRLSIDRQQFKDVLKDWDLVELMQGDDLIGVVMIKGNELHVSFKGVPKSSIRRHIKATMGEVMKKYGYVVTLVSKGNDKGLDFCKRFGYYITGEDSDKIYMRCDRSNYVR
jgi:hypothetical protein